VDCEFKNRRGCSVDYELNNRHGYSVDCELKNRWCCIFTVNEITSVVAVWTVN
jgi:hypothetical protein